LLDVMKLVLKGVTPNPWTAIGWFGKKYIGIIGKWLRLNTCSWPIGFELGQERGNLSNTKLLSKRTWADLDDPEKPKQDFKDLLAGSDVDLVTETCFGSLFEDLDSCDPASFESTWALDKTSVAATGDIPTPL